MLRIAVDAMGGDHGPPVTVPAALASLARHADLEVILVGDQNTVLRELFRQGTYPAERVIVQHAPEIISADDSPAFALRRRRQSSMSIAVEQVAAGRASACVSAGNTGALMAFGRRILGTFDGIRRPAICAAIPTRAGHSHVLDLGANINCKAEQLVQFALMGSLLVAVSEEKESPRVALLNVGEEAGKGSVQVRTAGERLREMGQVNYVGFIEGHDLFRDAAEVIVCDGFVGNITLKASEELIRMMGGFIRAGFQRNWFTRLVGALTLFVLGPLRRQLDPAQNNGASLLGLRGTVVKSHGSANVESFRHAIENARLEAQRGLPERIERLLASVQAAPAVSA